MVDGPYPQRLQHIFKSEDTSEHKSEDCGEESGCGDNPRQRDLLKVIDQCPTDEKEKSLSDISEHDSENKGVGQSDKYSRVHLIVGGKSIHLNEHFKRLEKLWILKLGRRLTEVSIMVIFNDNEDFVIIFDLFKKTIHIILCHPAAENIVIFLILIHTGRHFADIKIIGQFF